MGIDVAKLRGGIVGACVRAALCCAGFAAFAALCLVFVPDGTRWGWIAACAGFSLACFLPRKKKMGRRLWVLYGSCAALAALTFLFLYLLPNPLAAFLAALGLFILCAWACREARKRHTPWALCLLPPLFWSGYLLFVTYMMAMLAP